MSSVACGINLAVGDSARCRAGVRFGAARCAGGSLGMAFTGGGCTGAALGCCSCGSQNDGAEAEVDPDDVAVCSGRDNVGVADGERLRLGDGNLDVVGVGERVRLLCRP